MWNIWKTDIPTKVTNGIPFDCTSKINNIDSVGKEINLDALSDYPPRI